MKNALRPWWNWQSQNQLQFPDKRLVQWDCGKLQTLDLLLRRLKEGKHRCLIFTQMSKMLNVLEVFLNLHGHTYLRLDGSTHVEARQQSMDRFNTDTKVFCFILSTRSGGLGINLTGADTVIFYDSDWNPAMDAQAQDRAHRIGQTREVHIYRLVSRATIEENILLKANQKRDLNRLSIEEGQYNTRTPEMAAAAAASAASSAADQENEASQASGASTADAKEVARLGGDADGFSIFKKGSLRSLLGDAVADVEQARRERGAAVVELVDGDEISAVAAADANADAETKQAGAGAGAQVVEEEGAEEELDEDAEEAQVRAAMAQLEDQTDASAALRAAKEVADEGRLVNEGDVTAAAGKVSAGAKAVREDTEALTKAEADQWRATGNRLRNMLQNLPGIQQCVSASLFHLSSLERYTRF
jgi:superfamily II DNA/RNA helicase